MLEPNFEEADGLGFRKKIFMSKLNLLFHFFLLVCSLQWLDIGVDFEYLNE